jgi:outer membrane lipoprotein-sorting protein
MSKLHLGFGLTLAIAIFSYAPDAEAVKVTRDPNPPAPAAVALPPAAVAKPAAPAPHLPALTAAQIADKNVAARGGLKAWRAVKALTLSGKLDAGGKKPTQLPVTMQAKRPHKERVLVEFAGQTALQVFDGAKGWTYRPYLGRSSAEPFSPEEQRKSAANDELDGPLIDYAAKGSKIELEGTEMVEASATYRLKVTRKDGVQRHVWIDGKTFLESKIEGNPHRFDGKMRGVQSYLRDYRSVDGLMIPFESETRLEGVRVSHKLTLEKVEINPTIEDRAFSKPEPLTASATQAAHSSALAAEAAPH